MTPDNTAAPWAAELDDLAAALAAAYRRDPALAAELVAAYRQDPGAVRATLRAARVWAVVHLHEQLADQVAAAVRGVPAKYFEPRRADGRRRGRAAREARRATRCKQ